MPGAVYNYSGTELAILHEQSSNLVGHTLRNQSRTPPLVEPRFILPVDRDDYRIRDSLFGWKLEPNCDTYIYRKSGFVLLGPVELDLHCIPPTSRLTPAYSKASKGDVEPVAIDEDKTWGSDIPEMGQFDGYREIEWENYFKLFESKTAKFIRTGLEITVRIQLTISSGVSSADVANVHTQILAGIDKWNTLPPVVDPPHRMKFHIELVDEQPDYNIEIKMRPTPKSPNNTKEWWHDIKFNSVAHEFGHLLGLYDEYYVYRRNDHPLLKTNAQKRAAEKQDYPNRSDARQGTCSKPANLMENNHSSPLVIDDSLILSVYTEKNQQKMCFR